MQNIAEIRIIGRIGKVDIKDKVTFINIASNYPRKVSGKWENETYWNTVTFFGKTAQRANTLTPGDLVHLTGRVRNNSYEKDGHTNYTVNLIADRFAVLVKAESG